MSRPDALAKVSVLRRLASIFLPQFHTGPLRSLYEGDPDQARKERPLQTSSQTRWHQSDIEDAIRFADSGDLSKAARIARSMRRDALYSGVLSTRAGGLTRLPKVFRGTQNVVDDLTAPGGLFERVFSPKEVELFDSDGIALGVGVGEFVPVPCRAEPLFVRLDPEYLRYVWSDDAWYYLTVAGRVLVTPGDGRWLLHTPGGYQAPWTNGLWPSLARAYVAKEHAYLYRENYSAKLANPARIAVSPQGAADKLKNSFFQKVMAWGINTVFGLPPGWDVKLLESNGRGYDVFTDTINSADREFMIGLAGQVVTVDGGVGFANADIHATIRTDLIQGDGDGLSATLNRDGLRPLVNRLYGGGAWATVAWDTRPPADLNAEAIALSAAAKAVEDLTTALKEYGFRVDVAELVARFKIPAAPISLTSEPAAIDDGAAISPPTDEAAASLAAKMTEHGVTRCEHGSSNRCRLCGVERVRDFVPGPDGALWQVGWRPISQAAPAAPAAPPSGTQLRAVA